jgi:glycosyltransferase involved in cell wall biosynthesis
MAELPRLEPETLQFVLLSFEGPDEYSTAGGLGVRMKELALELARQGFTTHLVFVGDPDLPGQSRPHENLVLHRWCQWISQHYRDGVYAGEEGKLADWDSTVPAFVTNDLVAPAAKQGRLTAVLAEEWHTANSTCLLSDHLYHAGIRDKAVILWNANNVMGFDRIDWSRLGYCSQITTVSRYMKHIMWGRGVNPVVIPNGIPADRIQDPDPNTVRALREAVGAEHVLFKIGRWSPDKRWNMAVAALAEERRRGRDTTMVIRGGIEPHALEVLHNAHTSGLSVADVRLPRDTAEAIEALAALPRADIYNVQNFMSDELISLFYAGADAVLANSGHEPFGLVGLEVMAVGGLVFVGSTGEDYAVPYLNAVVLDSDDAMEISVALEYLRKHPDISERIREEARQTARSFSWSTIIEDTLITKLRYVAMRQDVRSPSDGLASLPIETSDSTSEATKGPAKKTTRTSKKNADTEKGVGAKKGPDAKKTGDAPTSEATADPASPVRRSSAYGGKAAEGGAGSRRARSPRPKKE